MLARLKKDLLAPVSHGTLVLLAILMGVLALVALLPPHFI